MSGDILRTDVLTFCLTDWKKQILMKECVFIDDGISGTYCCCFYEKLEMDKKLQNKTKITHLSIQLD